MPIFLTKDKIESIFQIFHDSNPEPVTELEYTNLFTLVCSVALSAQTTDKAVNKATKDLYKIADNPKAILELGEEKIKKYISGIGLFNVKAKNLIKLSNLLIEEYNSEVPLEFDELIKLPGVGRKTANVVLNCWLGIETMPVDTHVFRVARRIGFSNGKTPIKVETDLLKKIPKKWMKYAHHWLILHGRYICTAKNPKCMKCPISQLCKFKVSSN